jgi:fibronectin-binding autotransporter adhesin
VSLVRVSARIFAACLVYGVLALAQVNGQQAPSMPTATVPRLIQIKGSVHDETGKPLTGNIGITFTLYTDASDQVAVWQENQNVQLDSAGRYSVLLGATNEGGLPLEIFSTGEARWLGVRPEGQAEQPRILFLSVAYALKAADTEMLGGKPASAYVLADSLPSSPQSSANTPRSPLILVPPIAGSLSQSPQGSCSAVTSDGTATANQVAKFTTACNIENSAIFESGGNVGIGNTSPAGNLDVSGTVFTRGLLSALGGAAIPPSGTATPSQGYTSEPLDIEASLYNTTLGRAATYIFQWQAEPVGNDGASTSATLNLLYGVAGDITETGISVNNNGIMTFASGQKFPGTGSGTVTSVGTGAGLTGGPITGSGTISIPSAGVTNSMLANPSVTVTAGSGLSGGGTVALGGTITLTNSAPSLGGTVTSVGSGTGLTGGPITTSGTLSLNTSYTNGLYLQLTGGTLTGGLTGTTGTFTGALSATSGTFSSTMTAAGGLMPTTGTATASKGFISNPFDWQASSFSSKTSAAVSQDFRFQAEPTGNDSSTPSGTLNLLFGSNGTAPAETGLSIASNGLISFASGQTFPGTGSGTVTSVGTGAGLTGGPITGSGTISIPAAGVTNSMIANPSVTVTAGSGLSGGGTVALGGTITLTNSAPSLGGTVTSVGSGTGLTGGPITTNGTLSLNTTYTNGLYLQLTGGTLTGGLTGTTGTFTGALGAAAGTFSGTMTAAAGALMPTTGTATASKGFISNPSDWQASSFSSKTSAAVAQDFRWQAEPTGNDSSTPSGTLNLLFGSNGSAPAETGLFVASNGLINFASGQTFPGTGSGTVTSVGTGAGLTGGPITGSGTISIPSAGVTNSMIANPSVTVTAGSGLSGGGTVALGGTITLTNSAPSLGGTVTSVGSGTGLTGGPITTNGTLSLNTSYTNSLYLQLTGGTLTGGLTGTTGTFTGALGAAAGTFSGTMTAAAGALMPTTGTATASKGFISNPLDWQASSFSSATSSPVAQDFRWQAEPAGNDSSTPSGTLNLLFGSNGTAPAETGLSIASNGLITFANGQSFPGGGGGGTVTQVNTGAGLTGGPITQSGTISIPAAGVSNSMLVNPSITVTAGSGLSGGGTVALGGTVTLTNSAPSLGGTVTSVGSGTGLTGGPITTNGTLSLNTTYTDGRYLQLTGGTLTGGLTGTTGAFTAGLASSTGTFTGALSAAGALMPTTGTATASKGFNSNPLDWQASSFSSATSSAVAQDFRWQAEPAGNDSSTPSGTLNLLFGSNGTTPGETGLSIASNGLITFANGQTFPGGSGGGTVTQVNTGAGLTGGPITQSGTISIPSAGVVNSMLANSAITVTAGTGLSGGGTVALGGTITLSSTSSGGTVTQVNTGAGLTGGPITQSGTVSIPAAGVTNSMLVNPFVTVQAGTGLSGGGTVALGGTVTLSSNLAGTTNGVAYFSSPTNLTSTPAPTNGQILIGSTGNAPTLSTLTAGQNITITNAPGSVTISAASGSSATLPFFVTGAQRTGAVQAATQNVNKVWGIILPYNVTTTTVTYDITTADNTANDYDIGIYNNSGNLVVDIGPTPGSTLASPTGFHTLTWTQGSTALSAGRYYLAITTNCKTNCAKVAGAIDVVSFAVNASAGASTGGALSATVTPPTDSWNTGTQPTIVIH